MTINFVINFLFVLARVLLIFSVLLAFILLIFGASVWISQVNMLFSETRLILTTGKLRDVFFI